MAMLVQNMVASIAAFQNYLSSGRKGFGFWMFLSFTHLEEVIPKCVCCVHAMRNRSVACVSMRLWSVCL